MSFLDFIPVVGPLLNFFGQERANDAQRDIAQGNNEFNAQQAQLNRDFQSSEYSTARDFSAAQADIGRNLSVNLTNQAQNYSERMSNTAYQRGKADLEAAGFNPMLSLMKGGASTPQGSVGPVPTASTGAPSGSQAQAAGLPQIHNVMSGAVSSAMDALRLLADVRLRNAEADAVEQNVNLKRPVEKGVRTLTEDIVNPASAAVSEAVSAIEDTVRDFAGSSASGVEQASRVATDIGKRVGPLGAGQEAVKGIVHSAMDAVEKGQRYVAADRPPPKASSFTGNQRKDLTDIQRISDPQERAAVLAEYNRWLKKGRVR